MMNESDRELLELAAKAVGHEVARPDDNGEALLLLGIQESWNPLTDDGDALRLAVQLNLDMRFDSHEDGVIVTVLGIWDDAPGAITETFEKNGLSATRRAIVRAAAEIGRGM